MKGVRERKPCVKARQVVDMYFFCKMDTLITNSHQKCRQVKSLKNKTTNPCIFAFEVVCKIIIMQSCNMLKKFIPCNT